MPTGSNSTAIAGGTASPSGGGGGSAARVTGRLLPGGVAGLMLVGRLGFAGGNERNAKQFALDVQVVSAEGRVSVETASGWIADQDGNATPFGRAVMAGEIAGLVGRDVAVVVSYNVTVNRAGSPKLYLSVERVVALDPAADDLR